MAVLYLRVSDDLHDTLKARAEAEGRSMANLAVWLLRQQLPRTSESSGDPAVTWTHDPHPERLPREVRKQPASGRREVTPHFKA